MSRAAVAALVAGTSLAGSCLGCRSAGGDAVVDTPRPAASLVEGFETAEVPEELRLAGHWDDLPELAPEAPPLPAAVDPNWARRERSGSVDSF
ncbi:hypothetical protein [Alienimonas californiensis]|uniref:Uncharacterized protein n=1 Tax=Alienimonas californiensis TaxID=2527989 RepID=A0A517PDL9_9PLAN|nr:hypothetical protein [Alienimonas californiensis]QDT17460.1 hypothetical protein CA12_35840 [Alienimonas californiensis]